MGTDHDQAVQQRDGAVVARLWERIQARDWDGARAVLDDDVVVEWPATGERIHGAAAFVEVQARYPQGWTIDVRRIVSCDDVVVSEVVVPHEGFGVFAVTSWWQVRDGRIALGREYWVTCGGGQPPAWRAELTSRYDGRP